MPLTCSDASKPDLPHTKKPYRPRRERASTSFCLTLSRLDCCCSNSSAPGGCRGRIVRVVFRLYSPTRSTANNILNDRMVTSSIHTNLCNFDHLGDGYL